MSEQSREDRLEEFERLGPAQVGAVLALAAAATEVDGVPPLNDAVRLHLANGGGAGAQHVLLSGPDGPGHRLLAYAYLTAVRGATQAELVVAPDARRQGRGRRMFAAMAARAPGGLQVWAHGDRPGAHRLAAEFGLHPVRRVLQLRRPLDRPLDLPLPPVGLPAGVTLRPFRPGDDDAAWLAVNARAFAWHPEQGRWTPSDLTNRMAEPWFDPDLFLVAERDGRMVGSHWIKVHEENGEAGIGEVYVLGVDPAVQGGGLGSALLAAGLERMRALHLRTAMLYVEGDNPAARATYSRAGFVQRGVDVLYRGWAAP